MANPITFSKITDLTSRQQEIVAQAAKELKIPYDEVKYVSLQNDIPRSISSENNGNREIIPLYGKLLKQNEKDALTQARLDDAVDLESLNGTANELGKNKKQELTNSKSERVKVESLANPTFDPSSLRRSSAGLPSGAEGTIIDTGDPIVKFSAPNGQDTRVRIVVPSGPLTGILLQGPVLAPLSSTNGVLFPYTPSISVSHGATYNAENLTHSNYAYQFYQSSQVEQISITATFACKNSVDAAYVIAAQHFFRTVVKMFYGNDPEAGLPPPVLRLEGHGDFQFGAHNKQVGGVPVAITSFQVQLPDDVDYITTNPITKKAFREAESNPYTAGQLDLSSKSQTRVPVTQSFNITCIPLYSRKSISQEFGFRKFASGQLLANGNRGGFI